MIFKHHLFNKYLGIYHKAPFIVRLHVIMRLLSCPFFEIEQYIPKKGIILDLGCGYGCFAHYFYLTSPERTVIGCDTAENKIAHALNTLTDNKNVKFYRGDINHLERESIDCITIIDVLYLIPFEDWYSLLERCYRLLKVGGILLLKEMDKKPSWKFNWNTFQETLAVKLFKITSGSSFYYRKPFYYKTSEELVEDLIKVGFKIKIVRLDKGYLHPHILYVCQKS